MTLILREGTSADIDALYDLDVLCFAEPFRFDRRTMARLVRSTRCLTLLAELDGELAGFLVAEFGSHNPGQVYLATLDISPHLRRKGIALRLMERLEQAAQARGYKVMSLHVAARNEAALRFYEACGAVRVQQIREYYAPGEHAWVYEKQLEPEKDGGAGRDRTGA